MPRFFVKDEQISDGKISVMGEDAHHIARSLRMAVGDEVTVCDTRGNEYLCKIDEFYEDKEIVLEIKSKNESTNEPKSFIRLFQALPKGDKLDIIIQKAVECGACEIIPFSSDRCVVKVKSDNEERKTERRQRIAAEAAKQCGRSILPKVRETVTFDQAVSLAKDDDLCLFCYEGGGEPLGKILKSFNGELPKRISFFVGSEGGFSPAEAEKAKKMQMQMTGLGNRILRTETASGFVLACISLESELS